MENELKPAPATKRPWPMSWVVFAIVTYIVVYTLINIFYRKPEPSHEPAAEAEARLLEKQHKAMLNWTRFRVTIATPSAETPTEGAPADVRRNPAPERLERALPIELVVIMPGRPALARGPASLTSAATAPAAKPLKIEMTFSGEGLEQKFGETLAYAKDHHLFILLQDKSHTGIDDKPVPAAPNLELELPADILEPGEWQASFHAKDAVFNWSFQVN